MANGFQAVGRATGSRERAIGFALLLLRLALAAIFVAHGAQKLFGLFGGGGIQGTAAMFESMGLKPAALMALLAGSVEFFGGAALFLGLLTRPAALLLALQMIFAAAWVHLANGFFINWTCAPGVGHGYEYNLVLVGALLALALAGPGAIAADARLSRRR